MKPLDQAKSRLWSTVTAPERAAVILMMLDTVVRAVTKALGPSTCYVMGGDERIRAVSEDAQGVWCPDTAGGLNEVLWHAMHDAYAEGCDATLFIPGDLPMIQARDIERIVDASLDLSRPVGVMAGSDGGTNALLVPKACRFMPQLGIDSFAKHRVEAERTGTILIVLDIPRVAFDVDSYEDLAMARQRMLDFDRNVRDWQRAIDGTR